MQCSRTWFPRLAPAIARLAAFPATSLGLPHQPFQHNPTPWSWTTTFSAPSLGLPRHCGMSSRRRSDRHLCSASTAVFIHPYGFLALCKIHLQVLTHSGEIPELACERTWTAHREAAGTCMERRRSRSSLEGVAARPRTPLPRLATTTARLAAFPATSLGLPHQPFQHNPTPWSWTTAREF